VVDILPVEAGADIMEKYKILAFLGWNTAEPKQTVKLAGFVKNGAALLLGLPHLFTSVKRSEAMGTNPCVLGNENIRELIGAELCGFVETVNLDHDGITAGKILLESAVPIMENTEGIPLVIENKLGKGRVIFVNAKAYPAEKSVINLYENLLKQLGEEMLILEKDKGWLKCSNEVEFTAFDHNTAENLRTIYFMNVNWWTDESVSSEARLLWGERDIRLDVYRENINILNISDNWAIWTFDNETDVMDMQESGNELSIKLQGMGSTDVVIFNRELDNEKYDLTVKCREGYADLVPLRNDKSGWRVNMRLNGPLAMEISLEGKK
jgi:hypothetical protein